MDFSPCTGGLELCVARHARTRQANRRKRCIVTTHSKDLLVEFLVTRPIHILRISNLQETQHCPDEMVHASFRVLQDCLLQEFIPVADIDDVELFSMLWLQCLIFHFLVSECNTRCLVDTLRSAS